MAELCQDCGISGKRKEGDADALYALASTQKSPAEAGLLYLHEAPSAHLGDAVFSDY